MAFIYHCTRKPTVSDQYFADRHISDATWRNFVPDKNATPAPKVRQSEIRRISPIRSLQGDTDQERNNANPDKSTF